MNIAFIEKKNKVRKERIFKMGFLQRRNQAEPAFTKFFLCFFPDRCISSPP